MVVVGALRPGDTKPCQTVLGAPAVIGGPVMLGLQPRGIGTYRPSPHHTLSHNFSVKFRANPFWNDLPEFVFDSDAFFSNFYVAFPRFKFGGISSSFTRLFRLFSCIKRVQYRTGKKRGGITLVFLEGNLETIIIIIVF